MEGATVLRYKAIAIAQLPPRKQNSVDNARLFGQLFHNHTLSHHIPESPLKHTLHIMTIYPRQAVKIPRTGLESPPKNYRKMLVTLSENQSCPMRCKVVLARDQSEREATFIKRSNSCHIRSKFFNRLGIEKEHAAYVAARTEPSMAVQRGYQDAFHVVLKSDHGNRDKRLEAESRTFNEVIATSPGSDHVEMIREKPEGRRVVFDTAVKVHPIPARSDYSTRMQAAMWISHEELQQNAARNQFEFAAEEWNANNVVDEDKMIHFEGELVHPVHFMQEQELKEFFDQLMERQKQKSS